MATLTARSKRASFTPSQWEEILQRLADQVTGWAQEEGWAVQRMEAQVFEGYPYPPTLDITAPEGSLKLEMPSLSLLEVGRVPRPKLCAWSSLYRVWLKYQGEQGDWEVWTDSGIPIHEDWSAKTFTTVARDLLGTDR